MIDFTDRITFEELTYNNLEKALVKDAEALEHFEMLLHEIIANACCDYAYDEKIDDYTPYF